MANSAYFGNVVKKVAVAIPKIESIVVNDMAVKSDQYVPEDTGKTRVDMDVDLTNNRVIWSNAYVEYIFWGIGLNFQTIHNAKAQSMWTDRATKENIKMWEEAYIDAIVACF